jgi:hypothetical protein
VKDGMDKTIRRYTSLDEMKDDEYRYWQSRPVYERMAAVAELSQAFYGSEDPSDESTFDRTLVRVERP